ncbi:MAG: exodeoxyribonuclease VII large subunit [Deltaproteobacteria bacterium]|nr:exodeoxyribonuclease VII large subunit [Deltaproteobacteria bacterium]MBN2671130.1 exodeoxyribonuclease VII large subunit [Deltaproteobacteria bacterium]
MNTGAPDSIYTVSSLNKQVKNALERTWGGIWLEAEVTSVTFAGSGHVYFKLIDPGKKATVDAVMWRGMAVRYGRRIQEGALLRCFGRVTLYELGGRYQFVAERIEDSGEGAKARALAELKERLLKEGLFAPEKKRMLPGCPSCVGVVTSRTGAALQDIITVASRRFPTHLLLAHASVQGESAAREIADAVRFLSTSGRVDVLIVGRGGGSSEDLDAFNDEAVVRAVAESPVPVVCAVGHEVDTSLAELAADRRAATPSEAAELVVPRLDDYQDRLQELKQRLWMAVKSQLTLAKQQQSVTRGRLTAHDPRVRLRKQAERLSSFRAFFTGWKNAAVSPRQKRLDDLTHRLMRFSDTAVQSRKGDLMAASEGLYRWPKPALQRSRADLVTASSGLFEWPRPTIAQARGDLGRLMASLDALSPLASLRRGYSIVRDENQKIVKSVEAVSEGERIEVIFTDGTLGATVDRTSRTDESK